MPYYSELGITTTPSSIYPSSLLTGPYSKHSSIIASNIIRPAPSLSKPLPRNFRGYKPHLATISESHSPLRRINSPKIIYSSVPKVRVERPIKINTADIDVSVNKYRKYDRPTQVKPKTDMERKSPESKSPSPSKTFTSPRNSVEEKEAKPNTNIRRDRATVRLQTIHKDKLPLDSNKFRTWRDNFQPEELGVEEKREKKTPGQILKEKFLIRTASNENIHNIPETKKITRKQSVKKNVHPVQKTPSFHDICSAITSDTINEELNPGQPAEVTRRQSRQLSSEDILKEIRRNSTELSLEDVKVIDNLINKGNIKSFNKQTSINEEMKSEIPEKYDSRGSVKKKRKVAKKKSNEHLTINEDDVVKSPLQRRLTQKKIRRTSTDSSFCSEPSDPEVEKAYQEAIRDISQVEIEKIKIKPKPIITAQIDVEESTKPILKAVVDEIEIIESPKPKRSNKFKFNVTVEEIEEKRKSVKTPEVEKKNLTLSRKLNKVVLTDNDKGVVQIPKPKDVVVSNILKKKHHIHVGHALEYISDNLKEVTENNAIKIIDVKKPNELRKCESDVTEKKSVENVAYKDILKPTVLGKAKSDPLVVKDQTSNRKFITNREESENVLKRKIPRVDNKGNLENLKRELVQNSTFFKSNTNNESQEDKVNESTMQETKAKSAEEKSDIKLVAMAPQDQVQEHESTAKLKDFNSEPSHKSHETKLGETLISLTSKQMQESENSAKVVSKYAKSETEDKIDEKKLAEKLVVSSTPEEILSEERITAPMTKNVQVNIKDETEEKKLCAKPLPEQIQKELKLEVKNGTKQEEKILKDSTENLSKTLLDKDETDKIEITNPAPQKKEISLTPVEKKKVLGRWGDTKIGKLFKENEKTANQKPVNPTLPKSSNAVLKNAMQKKELPQTNLKKDENDNIENFWDSIAPQEDKPYELKKLATKPNENYNDDNNKEPTNNSSIIEKKMMSKRSLIQKANKDDTDLEVFVPPEPEPEPEPEPKGDEGGFVPLQSNRLSQFMHPWQKPEQYEECPVEIFARPKTIRKRHYPRPRHQPVPAKIEESSEEESDESSSSEEDSSSEDESGNTVVYNKVGASTSSNDSGFDSGVPGSRNKGSSENRDSPLYNPANNPAFALDPGDNPEEYSQSSTYAGFQKSGRITPPATTIPRFRKYCVEDFNFLKVLGKGSFGKVLLAELKNTEYYYAIKCLKKDVVLEDDDVECTLIERKVLALGTKHPYLCHLLCTFQTDSHLFFVMEYLNGGDLMFHIQQNGRFPESWAKFYGAEIVSGLKFLHNKGIIYRDLKLDNILLDFDGHVRIADFGMCKLQVFLDRMADTFCGTPDYMAPEIIKGQHYNQCVDWWSFGVLLYEMLIGQSPFSGCDEDELFWSICNEKPVLPKFLSHEAHSVLLKFLEKDWNKRLGNRFSPAGDIQDQPFFRGIDWIQLENRQLEAPFKPNLQHPLDTQYFDKTFTTEKAKLTPIEQTILESMDQTQFQGFSYTNPNATDK